MPYNHVYTLRHQATVSTAISVLQLAAGALCPFEILSASANQRGSTVSVQEKISLLARLIRFGSDAKAGDFCGHRGDQRGS